MNALKRFKKELFYCGLTKEEFLQVKNPIGERNQKSIIPWSGFAILFWTMSLLLSIKADNFAHCRIVYLVALIIDAVTLLCALFLIKPFPKTLFPVMYLYKISLLGAGIGIAVCQPDVRTVTMIAIAVLTPVCFIDRTSTTILLQIITLIVYTVLGKNFIVSDIYYWGLQNLTIFSIAGVLSGHVINKARFERYLYADSKRELAEIQTTYNTELQKEVDVKTERILALQDQFLIGMATMVESRDNSTGGHIRRTSAGVKILVSAIQKDGSLHLSEETCEKIAKAAPMHDLGKITVDDAILRKPGRYTPEEYNEMKTHAEEGARIVHQILIDIDDNEFRTIAENMAHYHHERVDGTGYPDGLKGDEIPLEARIMAFADVYDALVSKRVYKDRYSFEKANQIILDGMGTQFDSGLKKYYEEARPALEEYYSKVLNQE